MRTTTFDRHRVKHERQALSDTPLALLYKFQANPTSLNEAEKSELWGFFDGYVARCEKTHFGSKDERGKFQDQRTVRIIALWQMMLELRDAQYETYPFFVNKTAKRARACKVTAPLRHPNLILTYYRRTFPNLELIIRSRILFGVDLKVFGLTWDVNSSTINRLSKIAAKFREGSNKSLPLDVYNALAQKSWTPRTKQTWLRACCSYYLWLRYQCRSLSLETQCGDVDRLTFSDGADVFK